MLVPVLHAAHRTVQTFRAIPTYALYVAMKDRMQFWLENRFASAPKALNPFVWGEEVLPCVLDALYDCEGSGYGCKTLQDFPYFLRPAVVYNALSRVLVNSVLPLDGRTRCVPCFKVLRSAVRQYIDAVPVYMQDWVQMALRTAQYALTELFPTGSP